MLRLVLFGLSALLFVPPSPAQPIPFELDGGLISVPVEVGERTLPLMLDLGDFRALSLSSGVLDTVAVAFTGEVDVYANFAGDRLEARRFVARDVALGLVRHDSLAGSEDVFDPANLSPNPYGAIGRGFFGERTLTLHYADSTLTIGDERVPEDACLRLDDSEGMLRVRARVDGAPRTLLVDTGAMVSVLDTTAVPETERVQGDHSAYRAASVELDGEGVGEALFFRVGLGAPGFDGILGADILGRYRVRMDLRQDCLALLPQAP